MILHRLTIEDFRGVVREEVDLPPRGVLVIEGPNESGKTSLMDALEMLLEHKADPNRANSAGELNSLCTHNLIMLVRSQAGLCSCPRRTRAISTS